MNYSLIKKIQSIINVIDNHGELPNQDCLDFLLGDALKRDDLKNESPIEITSCIVDLFKKMKSKNIEIKIPGGFIDRLLDVLIKQSEEGEAVDSVALVNSLERLMKTLAIKLTDTSRGKLLDLFIKNTEKGCKCNLWTLIEKFIALDQDESKKFLYNAEDEKKFVNLLNIKQDHCNIYDWIASLKFFLNEMNKKFSDSSTQIFLEALKNKINKGTEIINADIESLTNLKAKMKISDDFMNQLFNCLLRTRQDHETLSENIQFFTFFVNQFVIEYSEDNEEALLDLLKNKINKGTEIINADIESLTNLKKNVKISDDFMNQLFEYLLSQIKVDNKSHVMYEELNSMDNIIYCKVLNSKKERRYLETLINKLLKVNIYNQIVKYNLKQFNRNHVSWSSYFKNFNNQINHRNEYLKIFIQHIENRKYRINIPKESLQIFFDLLIKDSRFIFNTYTINDISIDNVFTKLSTIFNFIFNNADSIDNKKEVSYYCINEFLKLCAISINQPDDSYFNGYSAPDCMFTNFRPTEIINYLEGWINANKDLAPINNPNLLKEIQSSIITMNKAKPKITDLTISLKKFITTFNLLQINSTKDDCKEDCEKLCAFLENLPKNANCLEGKLLRISAQHPFTNFRFTQYIIKNCKGDVVGVFYYDRSLEDSSGIFYNANNNNYKKKLLEGSKKFLINSHKQFKECEGLLEETDERRDYQRNIESCLLEVTRELNGNKNSMEAHEENSGDTGSIAASTTGLINSRAQKNFNLQSFFSLFQRKDRIVE